MIYAELTGGLGNQMFVYAFARALGLSHSEDVTLIDRQDAGPAHTACGLSALRLCPGVAFVTGAGFAKERLPRQNAFKALMIRREQRAGMMAKDWNPFERRMAPLLNLAGVHFATDGFVPCRRHPRPADFLLWGYFQSEEYFAPYKKTVLAELRPKTPATEDPALGPLAKMIDDAPCPVCLHVRRGDYQKPENAALQVCTPAYYTKALRRVLQQLPNAALFVFSDDIAWCKSTLDVGGLPTVFMEGARSAAGELALMQRCRHFVLSNSTFSWWAQELCTASEKQVFAPTHWYANGKHSALYGPSWQRIAP